MQLFNPHKSAFISDLRHYLFIKFIKNNQFIYEILIIPVQVYVEGTLISEEYMLQVTML